MTRVYPTIPLVMPTTEKFQIEFQWGIKPPENPAPETFVRQVLLSRYEGAVACPEPDAQGQWQDKDGDAMIPSAKAK